jgi:1,4-alpha-glucan branching enzyme
VTPARAVAAATAMLPAPSPAASAPADKSTQQKIDDFYGVKQFGDEVVFAAKFDKAGEVLVAGDFNNWNPVTPMKAGGRPGTWTMKLPLRKGRYRYRLVVDGQWMTDPHNQYVEANQFGELNNVIEVQ